MAKTSKKKQQKAIQKIGKYLFTTICIIVYLILFAPDILDAFTEFLYSEGSTPVSVQTEGSLSLHVIDVGQGDSTLIVGPQKTVLIDAGENDQGETVTQYIKDLGISTLDLVVATHSHSDHMGGLDVVINSFTVKNIAMPDIPKTLTPTTKTFTDFLTAAKDSGANTLLITEPFEMDLGGGGSIAVFPPSITPANLNDTSLYTRVSFGAADFLGTGDAEKASELSVLDSPYLQGIEVLSVGHHGSNTSSTQEFLDRVKPLSTYISLAAGNSYRHPHKEPLARLKKLGATVNRTDLEGSIVYTTDGKSIQVKSAKSDFTIAVKEQP